MSTVAALARDGHVLMAADSLVNVYERPIVDGCRKIRRLTTADGDEFLIGCSGAAGMPSAVTAGLKVETVPSGGEDLQLWAEAIAHAATGLAFDYHQADDGHMDATLLLGWNGELWTLGNGVAIPHRDGVAAIGSGEGPAIGAIDALLAACPDLPLQQVLGRALTIATARDMHSAEPIWVELLPRREG